MSSYENYTHKSRNYDKTREPVGTEISVGCFAHAPVPLDRAEILDAGCGTGNYSRAMLDYVGRIEAVDMNPTAMMGIPAPNQLAGLQSQIERAGIPTLSTSGAGRLLARRVATGRRPL